MRRFNGAVIVESGPGSWEIVDGFELFATVLRVIVYAINFREHSQCWCECKIAECDYCAHECPRGEDV